MNNKKPGRLVRGPGGRAEVNLGQLMRLCTMHARAGPSLVQERRTC